MQRGDGAPTVGSRYALPDWAGGLRHMLQVVLDSAEEGRKLLHARAAKRPHFNLLPDMKTSLDGVREQMDKVRERISYGGLP